MAGSCSRASTGWGCHRAFKMISLALEIAGGKTDHAPGVPSGTIRMTPASACFFGCTLVTGGILEARKGLSKRFFS